MADIFDNEIDQTVRERLWKLIEDTPWIDWQLLTKRIGNAPMMLPARWKFSDGCPQNIWFGVTVVNQEEVDRDVPKLFRDRFYFPVFWLSIEPQLGPIDLATWLWAAMTKEGKCAISWVVDGGESGDCHVRPFRLEWARSLRDQCKAAGVAYFMKQLGSQPVPRLGSGGHGTHYKWDEPEYWPEDLRVREFPDAPR